MSSVFDCSRTHTSSTQQASPPKRREKREKRPGQLEPESQGGAKQRKTAEDGSGSCFLDWPTRKERKASAFNERRPEDVKAFEAEQPQLAGSAAAAQAADVAAVQRRLDSAEPEPCSSCSAAARVSCWEATGVAQRTAYHGIGASGYVRNQEYSCSGCGAKATPHPYAAGCAPASPCRPILVSLKLIHLFTSLHFLAGLSAESECCRCKQAGACRLPPCPHPFAPTRPARCPRLPTCLPSIPPANR